MGSSRQKEMIPDITCLLQKGVKMDWNGNYGGRSNWFCLNTTLVS